MKRSQKPFSWELLPLTIPDNTTQGSTQQDSTYVYSRNEPMQIPTTSPAITLTDPTLPSELSIPISPILDDQTLVELEALNKELAAELALSSLEISTPTQEDIPNGYQLEDHPEDWFIIDSI